MPITSARPSFPRTSSCQYQIGEPRQRRQAAVDLRVIPRRPVARGCLWLDHGEVAALPLGIQRKEYINERTVGGVRPMAAGKFRSAIRLEWLGRSPRYDSYQTEICEGALMRADLIGIGASVELQCGCEGVALSCDDAFVQFGIKKAVCGEHAAGKVAMVHKGVSVTPTKPSGDLGRWVT